MPTTKRKSATKTRKSSSSTSTMDALELLIHDHEEVKKLFTQFEKSRDEAKQHQLAQQVCLELTVHTQLEEQSFYPEARTVPEMEDMIMESLEEHRQAKELVAKIQQLDMGDEHLEPDMKVLKEDIEHHVQEEEKEMFPALRKAWDKARREEMGELLMRQKQALKAQMDGRRAPEQRVTEDVREAESVRR
jgi:hemerythrin superfamily protein